MLDALLTSPLSLAIGVGILVTAFLGLLCGPFLHFSVTVDIPKEFEAWKSAQKDGGGSDLGLLERLLFFAAFWLDAHVIAGAWLAFKVAAKWAAWQHIQKIPASSSWNDDRKYLNTRFYLSSNVLGRFLNGTIYNIFCAGVGCLCGKAIFAYFDSFDSLPGDLQHLVVIVFIGVAASICLSLIIPRPVELWESIKTLWQWCKAFFIRCRRNAGRVRKK